jgi:hypothetical protein
MSNYLLDAPKDIHDWEARKAEARAILWHLLGDLPALFTPQPTVTGVEQRDGYTLEKLAFDNGAGAAVYGYVLIPEGRTQPGPAVLYHHLHGGKYHLGKDEMFQEVAGGPAPGVALVRAGYVVLGIDAYAFGERQQQGPAGSAESGWETELSLCKKWLWEGRSFMGMMLRDDLLALNVLLARPEVDPARVGAAGMSLGATRSTWLAALDERIKVVIPIAQLTRYRDFAAQGRFAYHSIYYYVPGMLKSGVDMEVIVSLAAPRPQQILIGDSDALSPFAGVQVVGDYARRVYELYGAADQFELTVYPGVGHEYTGDMLNAMLDGFRRYL